MCFALLGLLVAVSLHAEIAVAVQRTGNEIRLEHTGRSIANPSQAFPLSATSLPSQLGQQAEDRYQAEQLSEAIALWQQAVTRYEADGDRLNQSLVLSFLATAFDDLGQWMQANEAIEQAILLLNTQNPASHLETSSVLAQVLTTQGKLQLDQGQTTEALETWQGHFGSR